jgi:ribonuclease P protein component
MSDQPEALNGPAAGPAAGTPRTLAPRVRRRLREIARQVIPEQARSDLDYVLVGRQGALKRDFAVMRQELVDALKRLKALAVATP